MNLIEFVTLSYIYHGCSTWKTFWEEKFTLGEFAPVNMKYGGRCNFSKHREINNGYNYITLEILLKSVSLEK